MQSIKHMRQILNLTQKDLSAKAGISRSHLSEIESGKKSPSIEVVEKIALALGLDESWQLLYLESHGSNLIETVQCLDCLEKIQCCN